VEPGARCIERRGGFVGGHWRRYNIQVGSIGAQDVDIAVATVERTREMGIGTVVPDFEDGLDA
jgi:hypothetical protein